MGDLLGYARVSTQEQNARLQTDALTAAGCYRIFTDQASALIGYGGLGGDPDMLRTRLSSTTKAPDFSRVHGCDNPRFERVATQQLSAVDVAQRRDLVGEM